MNKMTRSVAFGLLLSSLCFLTGCGGGNTTVTGKVTYQGKTVVWGTVILVDPAGNYYQGTIQLDGSYTIADVPQGDVRIGVTSPAPPAEAGRGGRGGGGDKGGKGPPAPASDDPREKFVAANGGKAAELPPPPPGAWFKIPANLGDPMSSTLSGTVASGKPLNIDLK